MWHHGVVFNVTGLPLDATKARLHSVNRFMRAFMSHFTFVFAGMISFALGLSMNLLHEEFVRPLCHIVARGEKLNVRAILDHSKKCRDAVRVQNWSTFPRRTEVCSKCMQRNACLIMSKLMSKVK